MITLPIARRQRFFEDLLSFQLDELNGLGDRIRFLRCMAERHDAKLANVWARCQKIAEAVSWSGEEAVASITHRLRKEVERPEDAFGLLLLAERVGCDRALIRRWWMALAPSARRTVVQSGQLFVQASTMDGARSGSQPPQRSRAGRTTNAVLTDQRGGRRSARPRRLPGERAVGRR